MHIQACPCSVLRSLLLAAVLLVPATSIAGPPLLCHPFDTGGAASLPWGDGWNRIDRGYDTTRLGADTQRLLAIDTPVIARMETLRRAAIYASASGTALRDLEGWLQARVASAKKPRDRAMALFDAGYFAETLQDIARLQDYDMPGIGKVDMAAIKAILAKGDGSVGILLTSTQYEGKFYTQREAAVIGTTFSAVSFRAVLEREPMASTMLS